VGGVLDQGPEAGRRVPQGLLGPLQLQLLGDVAGGEDEPAGPAVDGRNPGPGAGQPAGLAGRAQHLDHLGQRPLLVGPAVQLHLAAGDIVGPQPGQAAGADHVGRPVAGNLLEAGIPAGHGAVGVEGGDPVGGVLDDLRQLGPLLEDGLQQLALLDGRPHLGRQGVQDSQLALLEALEAGAVVGAQHPDDLALNPHRGGQAVPPALRAKQLGQLAVAVVPAHPDRLADPHQARGQGLLAGLLHPLLVAGWVLAAAVHHPGAVEHDDQLGHLGLKAAPHLGEEVRDGVAGVDGRAEGMGRQLHAGQTGPVGPHARVGPAGPVQDPQGDQEQRDGRRRPRVGGDQQDTERQVDEDDHRTLGEDPGGGGRQDLTERLPLTEAEHAHEGQVVDRRQGEHGADEGREVAGGRGLAGTQGDEDEAADRGGEHPLGDVEGRLHRVDAAQQLAERLCRAGHDDGGEAREDEHHRSQDRLEQVDTGGLPAVLVVELQVGGRRQHDREGGDRQGRELLAAGGPGDLAAEGDPHGGQDEGVGEDRPG
jgi:hypothetical protein